MRVFDYFGTGPRMGCVVPIGLDRAGLLSSWHVDVILKAGGLAASLAELLAGTRARSRVFPISAPRMVHTHPTLFALNRLHRSLALAGRDASFTYPLYERIFRSVARCCESDAVFGMQSACLELFEGRRYRIMEQYSCPRQEERVIAHDELRRFPGWAPSRIGVPQPVDERMREEWDLAEVIWAPSQHVGEACVRWGADSRRVRVVGYPMPAVLPGIEDREPQRSDHLRVAFAGTLMLRKGVQYIYEALRDWTNCPIDMHFFGPLELTELGAARLSEVGTIHGPVSRDELLREMSRSDVLLHPALSEGSALVLGEAASVGLPIIATHESGPPTCALRIESCSGLAIREALESLLDSRDRLAEASAACIEEARSRTVADFQGQLSDLCHTALDEGVGQRTAPLCKHP